MGNLTLLACSPAINHGANIQVDTFGLTTDFAGGPRILQNKVDLGAYERLDGFQWGFNVVPASGPTKPDGHITLTNVTGGVLPYHFHWNTGDTTQNVGNLLPGQFVVSITDATGCLRLDTFTVTFTSGTQELGAGKGKIQVWPNPASEVVHLAGDMPGFHEGKLQVVDILGRVLLEKSLHGTDGFQETITVESFLPGLYAYRIVDKTGVIWAVGKLQI
jgi:hypothetical protein